MHEKDQQSSHDVVSSCPACRLSGTGLLSDPPGPTGAEIPEEKFGRGFRRNANKGKVTSGPLGFNDITTAKLVCFILRTRWLRTTMNTKNYSY